MKKLVIFLFVFSSLLACKQNKNSNPTEEETVSKEIAYATFGEKIDDAKAKTADQMLLLYKDMKVGDTINSKMRATINEVCSMKGCWMTLKMDMRAK